MKCNQAFTEEFDEEKVGGHRKCHIIHDLFKEWLLHLSSINYLTGYYLMYISHHIVISNNKY